MDRQITFIQKVVGSNTTNEDAVEGWENINLDPIVWAKVDQKPGREQVVADEIQAVINTSFVVDYRTDLNEAMRILLDDGRVFNIISISEHEGSRKGFLMISADKVPNEADPVLVT